MRHVALLAGLLAVAAGPACAETVTYLCTKTGAPRPDSELALDLSAWRSVRTDIKTGAKSAAEQLFSTGLAYMFVGQQDGVGSGVMHAGTLNQQDGRLTEFYTTATGRRYGDSTSDCRLASAQPARR